MNFHKASFLRKKCFIIKHKPCKPLVESIQVTNYDKQ